MGVCIAWMAVVCANGECTVDLEAVIHEGKEVHGAWGTAGALFGGVCGRGGGLSSDAPAPEAARACTMRGGCVWELASLLGSRGMQGLRCTSE